MALRLNILCKLKKMGIEKMNKAFIFGGVLFLAMLLVGCQPKTASPESITEPITTTQTDWKNFQLKDIKTGNAFTIAELQKPVLLETFAVWCPKCRQQQDEIKKLHSLDEEIISISLDVDPNEDESKVLEHIQQYRYDWYFAVAPKQLTQALIDEFGNNIVNAPGTPIILICQDLSSRLLPSGIKSVENLQEEISKC